MKRDGRRSATVKKKKKIPRSTAGFDSLDDFLKEEGKLEEFQAVAVKEVLARQIAEAIEQVTGVLGVAVVIEAQHMCMMMRGVEKQNSSMVTSVMLGEFRSNPATRGEFLNLVR